MGPQINVTRNLTYLNHAKISKLKTDEYKVLQPFLLRFIFPGRNIMSAPSEADVSKLDNPAWPKSNQQAITELCA